MSRWQPDARGRLRAAALTLFEADGFERTTTAQIAARAGLTERTFFRHFPDKREVLFGNQDALKAELVRAVTELPDEEPARAAVAAGLAAMGEQLQPRRDELRQFARVIAEQPELRERDLSKQAALVDALAAALAARGLGGSAAAPDERRPDTSATAPDERRLDASAARLTAEVAIAIFRVAFERWIADGEERPLARLALAALDQLGALTAPLQTQA
ncbi:TetR/AcrR family transcriptional regulator [Conexibacter sp. CPCC 206217]|uniref:TetR/AcrR family transcriptional regulator n=1 Tax=Conexibacter sp. CPCC 206217 TaxID=3064574 RepID=UPI002718B401|nr:TetR/AcrR family transcriptional regulator [Conexibacter sp. CPCC 206217]MDO8212252.1 helix-turn-helix domain-containing protein [Conexibacter sp. CPCC 206217]